MVPGTPHCPLQSLFTTSPLEVYSRQLSSQSVYTLAHGSAAFLSYPEGYVHKVSSHNSAGYPSLYAHELESQHALVCFLLHSFTPLISTKYDP